MSAVEYSMVFLSLVIGLVVFVFVGRWSSLIKNSRDIQFYFVLVLWSVLLFLFLVFRWFWDFNYYLDSFARPGIAIIFLLRPIILYFSVDLLLPEAFTNNQQSYFTNNSRKFFTLVTLLWTYEILLWVLFERNIFDFPRVLILVNLVLSISLIFVKRQSFILACTVVSFLCVFVLFMSIFLS
jgi:hypothetical protein